MKKIEAIIFDLDGLLIDSMLYWGELDKKICKQLNIAYNQEFVRRLSGSTLRESAVIFRQESGMDFDDDYFHKSRDVYNIYTKLSNAMPGANNLLGMIAKSEKKQAIATATTFENADLVIKRFGWQKYFDQIITSDDVNEVGKPDPKIFLYAAKKLKINPQKCVVFEDAENGVTAAKRADMYCVAVPNKKWSPGDFSKADLVANSLEDKEIFEFIGL